MRIILPLSIWAPTVLVMGALCVGCQTRGWTAFHSAGVENLGNKPVVDALPDAPVPGETAELDLLKKRAEAGDAHAQCKLAELYEAGRGVEQDYTEAFKWWFKAAKQGLMVAQHNVGIAYYTGLGVIKDSDEAVRWLSKAAEQGDSEAGRYAQRIDAGQNASPTVYAGQGEPREAATVRPLRGDAGLNRALPQREAPQRGRGGQGIYVIAPSVSTSIEARSITMRNRWTECGLRDADAVLVVVRSMLFHPLDYSYESVRELEEDAESQLNISGENFHVYVYSLDDDMRANQEKHTSYKAHD